MTNENVTVDIHVRKGSEEVYHLRARTERLEHVMFETDNYREVLDTLKLVVDIPKDVTVMYDGQLDLF